MEFNGSLSVTVSDKVAGRGTQELARVGELIVCVVSTEIRQGDDCLNLALFLQIKSS